MVGYRDMTFCTFYTDCDYADACQRSLTPEVIKEAKRWWGGEDVPICQFMSKPTCHSSLDED